MDWKLAVNEHFPLLAGMTKEVVDRANPFLMYALVFVGGSTGGGFMGSHFQDSASVIAIGELKTQVNNLAVLQSEYRQANIDSINDRNQLSRIVTENRLRMDSMQRQIDQLSESVGKRKP
jgi:hypothetical protein